MNTHARERKNRLRATKFASGKPALHQPRPQGLLRGITFLINYFPFVLCFITHAYSIYIRKGDSFSLFNMLNFGADRTRG
jgi:hypothetical protein